MRSSTGRSLRDPLAWFRKYDEVRYWTSPYEWRSKGGNERDAKDVHHPIVLFDNGAWAFISGQSFIEIDDPGAPNLFRMLGTALEVMLERHDPNKTDDEAEGAAADELPWELR